MDGIIYQTNLYVTQNHRRVSVLTKPELYGFLGINMVMGYHQLPSWKDYWRNDQDLSVPFISDIMPRNRFLQILSNIHVNDNTAVPNGSTDRLYKLRPLINTLNGNFTKLYNVSCQVSIDESMIIFKGGSSLKQYNPMKPIKRGYKLWSMADMDRYLYNFEIYQGKNQWHARNIPKYFGLGDSVVHQLTEAFWKIP